MSRPLPRWLTPDCVLLATLALVAASAMGAPKVVQHLLADGGFAARSQPLQLDNWSDITAFRNGSAPLGVNRDVEGTPHHESWINAGQWLRFDNLPLSRSSVFHAEVRVHQAWPRERAVPVTFRVEAIDSSGASVQTQVVQAVDQQADWAHVRLELGKLPAQEVSIRIIPTASQEVWTLLRDPRLEMN